MRLNISATSVRNSGGVIYVTISEGGKCKVSKLKNGELEDVITVQGSPCILLWNCNNEFLVSAGNVLYFVSNNEFKPVLRARRGNWFWHAVEACGNVFVQEYGKSLTAIYVSENLKDFKLLVSNKDVNPLSKHFHYIAFDATRNILIATLGMETLLGLLSPLIVDIAGGLYTKVRGNSFLYLLRRIGGYLVLIPVLRGVV